MPSRTPRTSSSTTSSSTDPAADVPLDLAPIPIVDNHCHSLLRRQPPDDDAFRIHLTETYFPEVARDDVPHTVFYQWTIRELAGLLDCEPTARRGARRAARTGGRGARARGRRARQLQDLADRHRVRGRHDLLARGAAVHRPVPDRGGPAPRADDRAADHRGDGLRGLPRRVPGVARRPARPRHRRPQVGHRVPDRAARGARRPLGRGGGLRRRPRGGAAGWAAAHRVEAPARLPGRHRGRGVRPPGRPDPVPHGARRPGPRPHARRPGGAPRAVLRPVPGRPDRAPAHRLPVRPVARLPRRDVPQRVRGHGRGDPVRGGRGHRDHARAAGPRAGEQDPVLDRRLARARAATGWARASAGGRWGGCSTSTSRTGRSTSGPRSTGPSGSCGATRSASTGSDRRRPAPRASARPRVPAARRTVPQATVALPRGDATSRGRTAGRAGPRAARAGRRAGR